jgi:hypothetical protein
MGRLHPVDVDIIVPFESRRFDTAFAVARLAAYRVNIKICRETFGDLSQKITCRRLLGIIKLA